MNYQNYQNRNNQQYQYKAFGSYACSLQIVNPLDRINNYNVIYLEPAQCYRLRPQIEGMLQSRNSSLFLDYSKREYPEGGYIHGEILKNRNGNAFGLLRIMMRQKEGQYRRQLYYREENQGYREKKIQNNIYDGISQGALKRARMRINTNRRNIAQSRIANAWRNRPRRPALGRNIPNVAPRRGGRGRPARYVPQQYGRDQARPAQFQ